MGFLVSAALAWLVWMLVLLAPVLCAFEAPTLLSGTGVGCDWW